MYEAPIIYDRRAVTGGIVFGLAILAAIITLVYAMVAAHRPATGITPVAPPLPVAPVPGAPLTPSQPPILIPDNA